jgi:oligopeptide/dipeptide ABC transporter ATP-binding protein
VSELDTLPRDSGIDASGEVAPLLEVRGLSTHFHTDRGIVKAVEDVSFEVRPGEVLAIVGESGSGKSVTSMSILGLVPNPPGRIVAGEILFEGEDLVNKPAREMLAVRGDRIAMIFQDPMTSLDPVFTVEDQMVETVLRHRGGSRAEAREVAIDMLNRVHVPDPARRLAAYPFELSGGLRQRVMIAMALSCQPALLIADEPTTALDVTVQAQILNLLKELQLEFGMAIILITHDFGVVSKLADRVVVMYAGRVMETASRDTILEHAQHPYTEALLRSRPRLGDKSRLTSIPGSTPNLANPLPGCPFANRCGEMIDACWGALPELRRVAPGQQARCIRREAVG